jgi:hypothetical protein
MFRATQWAPGQLDSSLAQAWMVFGTSQRRFLQPEDLWRLVLRSEDE